MTTQWLLAAVFAVGLIAIQHRISSTHDHIIEHLDRQIQHLKGATTVTTQDAVNAITDTLKNKVLPEILTKISDVQAQLDAANVPAEVVDLTALTAAAQALDDIVPDAPPAEPVE
jgi:type VI protein secretion system component VasF